MLSTLEYSHHYIDGQRVDLQTDHRKLLWLSKVKEPSGRIGRWVLRLSEYDAVISYKAGKYMHIADCMSRNALEDEFAGRSDHTEPSGIRMEDDKPPAKYELNCKELVAQKLTEYDVGNRTMLVECELALADNASVREGTVESQAGKVLRSEKHDSIDCNSELRDEHVAVVVFDEADDAARLDDVRGASTTSVEIPDSLQYVPIKFGDLRKAQQTDEKVQQVC